MAPLRRCKAGDMQNRRLIWIGAVALVFSSTAAPAQAVTFKGTYTKALASLTVSAEVRTGYERTKFKHWIDANGDGCDARDEVLIAEAVEPADIGASCDVGAGLWISAYDGEQVTNPSDLDIDHMVPLAEAWDSGARKWSTAQRQAFANDLGDPRSLIAVTASSNRSKSDQDPAEWLPDLSVCQYLQNWIAVKVRWRLSIDKTEKSALRSGLAQCPTKTLTVKIAFVPKASSAGGGGGGTSTSSAGSSSSGGEVYFENCTAVRAAGADPIRRGEPGYRAGLDRDGDGVGCE